VGSYGIIGAASSTALLSLAAGHPVRGGIDIGIGMEIEEDEIYGPCLAKAYTLESKIAQYPRIVIGPECLNYLHQMSEQPPENIFAQAGIVTAKACLDLLTIDDDGCAIVDYLGEAFRTTIATRLDKQVVTKAYDNIIKFSETYKHANDTLKAFRFTLLRDYFEHRLPEWGINR
jgi:hypothetical protein